MVFLKKWLPKCISEFTEKFGLPFVTNFTLQFSLKRKNLELTVWYLHRTLLSAITIHINDSKKWDVIFMSYSWKKKFPTKVLPERSCKRLMWLSPLLPKTALVTSCKTDLDGLIKLTRLLANTLLTLKTSKRENSTAILEMTHDPPQMLMKR